jgi:hypothetical protein
MTDTSTMEELESLTKTRAKAGAPGVPALLSSLRSSTMKIIEGKSKPFSKVGKAAV